MMSNAPSSTCCRHRPCARASTVSTTRMEYCSISSGCVVGTISTAICAPLAASNAASFCSSAALLLGGERAGEIGDARAELREWAAVPAPQAQPCASAASCSQQQRQRKPASATGAARRCASLRLGLSAGGAGGAVAGAAACWCRSSTVGAVEICCSFATVKFGFTWKPNIFAVRFTGNGAHRDVVALHRLDVAVARHGDAILGAFDLRLQIAEVLIRLQLRVVLGDRKQALERAA